MTNMTNGQNNNSANQSITNSYNAATNSTAQNQQATNSMQQPQQAAQPQQNMQASAQQPAQANAQQNMQANMQQPGNVQAKAVVGIFKDLSSAEQAVAQLRGSGFSTEEINIVSKDPAAKNYSGNDSIMDGTMTGGAIGGVGGLLLSAGALTIPGLGPIIAAGPLAATIAGAIGGGITGGLIDWGIPSAKSEEYNEEVSSGNTLAVIKTPENKVSQAVQILTSYGAMNVETHQTK